MTTTAAAPHTSLRMAGEMTIYRAAELKQLLLEPLQQPGATLEVDLSGVTELDTAGLQLLILAKRTARKQDGQLRLMGHSPAVLNVFDLLNLAAYFGDDLVIAQPPPTSARH
ncbi:MAG: STAS domain-containing protein [Giesbergeria sp.]|uniref:STAS domain-containing protein n=1 Tax=Giesbergeria sp. TaxID=2818473 RepID=UPI002630B7E8|nr:STAS domain-containing protein [Giesbergeria sp.]MDD2610150.1 STAS domain-containing protein [Giesbergeria sp.]